MKAIFDAIRAAKNTLPGAAGKALLQFERANRGHSHLIDELALEFTTGTRLKRPADKRERMETLRNSTMAMLSALSELPTATLEDPALASILDTRDGTQFLQQCLRDRLCRTLEQTYNPLYGPWNVGPSLQKLGISFEDDRLSLTTEYTAGPRQSLRAHRTLTLSGHQFDTLRGWLRAYSSAKLAFAAQAKQAGAFPEFSAEKQAAHEAAYLRSKFAQLMSAQFTREELTWLASNRSGLNFGNNP